MGYEVFENLCRTRKVTPSAVAKATGVAKSTLSAWKNGEYTPKADKLEKIADYFEVPLEYLMTGKAPEYYIDPAVQEIAQAVYDNPDIRVLFDAARDSTSESLLMAAEILKKFKGTNRDG